MMALQFPTSIKAIDEVINKYTKDYHARLEEYLSDRNTHSVFFYDGSDETVYEAVYSMYPTDEKEGNLYKLTCVQAYTYSKKEYETKHHKEYGVYPDFPHFYDKTSSPITAFGLQPFASGLLESNISFNNESDLRPSSLGDIRGLLRNGNTMYMRTPKGDTVKFNKDTLVTVGDFLESTYYHNDPVKAEAVSSIKHAADYLGGFSLFVSEKDAEKLNFMGLDIEWKSKNLRGYVVGMDEGLNIFYTNTDNVYYNLVNQRLEVVCSKSTWNWSYRDVQEVMSKAIAVHLYTIDAVDMHEEKVEPPMFSDF